MTEYRKPLPLADLDSEPYWEGTRQHELRAQRCSGCHELRWPPQGFCPHCYSWEFEWTPLCQSGTVESYVIVHQATARAFADDVPYAVARILIDNTDGRVLISSNVVGVEMDDIHVGMRVEAEFDPVTPEVTLPKFHPARE